MLSNEAIQVTQKRGVEASSVRVPFLDGIVPPRRPVVLKVYPPLLGRSQTAVRMHHHGVPPRAPLTVTDDLPTNIEGKHKRNNLRDLLAQRRPLWASSTSPGTSTRDNLAEKRHNARTLRVSLSPWQCAARPGHALHASRRSAPPATKKVQPSHAADARCKEGAEGAGRHVDEREQCERQSRTLRGSGQLSESCHRSLWSQVGWCEGKMTVAGSLESGGRGSQRTTAIKAAGARTSVNWPTWSVVNGVDAAVRNTRSHRMVRDHLAGPKMRAGDLFWRGGGRLVRAWISALGERSVVPEKWGWRRVSHWTRPLVGHSASTPYSESARKDPRNDGATTSQRVWLIC